MSIGSAFNAPFSYEREGRDPVKFSRLPLGPIDGSDSTIADVVSVIELRRRKKLAATASANGIKKEGIARFVSIGELEAGEIDIFHIDNYARSAVGAPDVCTRSLKVSGLAKDEIAAIIAEIPPMDLRQLAAFAIGTWSPQPGKPDDGDKTNPLPHADESNGSEIVG